MERFISPPAQLFDDRKSRRYRSSPLYCDPKGDERRHGFRVFTMLTSLVMGALIPGTLNQSAIGTPVERSSRFIMLVHLPHGRTAEMVRDDLIKTISGRPAHLRGSLAGDQTPEMAEHDELRIAASTDVSFGSPARPWQGGSTENSNGFLRRFFPIGTHFSFSDERSQRVLIRSSARDRERISMGTPEPNGSVIYSPHHLRRCFPDLVDCRGRHPCATHRMAPQRRRGT